MTGPVLLVATAGGHIDELYELADQFTSETGERVWVTSKTPQTESLLAGERVEWVPAIGSRQGVRAMASFPRATRLIRELTPVKVASTGAALAVPYLVAARFARVPTQYIESATRLRGPSLTGRLVERLPGMTLSHQSSTWSRRRWQPIATVFDRFETHDRTETAPETPRVLVTLGTERFPFPRAVQQIMAALPDAHDLVWQLGHTPPPADLPGTVHTWIDHHSLIEAMTQADVVITHAGVGSVLTALRSGHVPLIIPRAARYGEHVDDHQSELAAALGRRELAIVACPDAEEFSQQLRVASQRGARRRAISGHDASHETTPGSTA